MLSYDDAQALEDSGPRTLKNVIPDISCDIGCGESLAGYGGPAIIWFELKLTAAKKWYDTSSKRFNNAVRLRSAKVKDDYLSRLRSGDAGIFGAPPGGGGPLEASFRSVGFAGLVLGRYGESSPECSKLLSELGERIGRAWSTVTHMDEQRCVNIATRQALVAVTQVAQRAFARKIVDGAAQVRKAAGLAPYPPCRDKAFRSHCRADNAKWHRA